MKHFNLHTHAANRDAEVCEILNRYPEEHMQDNKFFSIGIHPWRIDESKLEEEMQIIKAASSDEFCAAIGECGLDKRIETPIDLQKKVFIRQLHLAESQKKPVIIHCVAAFQEVIEIVKSEKITVPCVIHGFSKNEQVAKQLLDNGFYLSFGKYLLRNPELESVFKSIPNDRFFLETDTIQEDIRTVYQKASDYKALPVEELCAIVNQNINAVFPKLSRLTAKS